MDYQPFHNLLATLDERSLALTQNTLPFEFSILNITPMRILNIVTGTGNPFKAFIVICDITFLNGTRIPNDENFYFIKQHGIQH